MRLAIYAGLVAATVALHATAGDYGSVEVKKINRITDGDTINVTIPEWPPILGDHASVRVIGIDAPEMRSACEAERAKAVIAKQALADLIHSAKVVRLEKMKRDVHFRIDAVVTVDGADVAPQLIKAGYVRAYSGKAARSSWCDATGRFRY
jgi:endonuclease YncB( thermonuclease family)